MKRFLKIVLIFTVFATALAYFAFRILFFDPFESALPRLDAMVPRGVHMVRRADLTRDFYRFPRPEFYETLQVQRDWREFQETPFYALHRDVLDLEPRLAGLEQQLADLPIDPLKDLLGREAMLLVRTREGQPTALALLARVSFKVKVAVEGVRFGMVRDLVGDALEEVEELDGGLLRVRPRGGQDLFLFRQQDVVVAANDQALLGEVRELARRGRDRLGMADSPQYVSIMNRTSDVGRPLDFAFDLGKVAREHGFGRFPADPMDPLPVQLLANSILPGEFGLTVGRLFLGDEVQLEASVGADIEALKPQAAGLLSGFSARLPALYEFAGRVLPPNVFAFACLKLDNQSLMRSVDLAIDADTRQLLEEFLREVNRLNRSAQLAGLSDFLIQLSGCMAGEILIALEPQSTYTIPKGAGEEGPPKVMVPQESWGPRFAVAVPLSNRGEAERLVGLLIEPLGRRTVQGPAPAKIYTWNYESEGLSFREIEWLDPELPPLSVGVVDLDERDWMVFTTTGQFLQEIVETRIYARKNVERSLASEQLEFRLGRESIPEMGQGVVYLKPEGLRKVLYELAVAEAEWDSRPDLVDMRERKTRELRDRRWPANRGEEVSAQHQKILNPEVDRLVDQELLRWKETVLPGLVEERRRNLELYDLLQWAVLGLRVNDTELRLSLRAKLITVFP